MPLDVHPALARYRSIVEDWPAFVDAIERPLPVGVWANPLRIDRAALQEHFTALGVGSTFNPWHPLGLTLPADARPGLTWALPGWPLPHPRRGGLGCNASLGSAARRTCT